jgi:hypothetical protein
VPKLKIIAFATVTNSKRKNFKKFLCLALRALNSAQDRHFIAPDGNMHHKYFDR